MRQIIHNLLRNAEDAQEGAITPTSKSARAWARTWPNSVVADAGPGFRRIIARVFEPYVTTKAKGTDRPRAGDRQEDRDEHHGNIDITNRQPAARRSASACRCLRLQPEESFFRKPGKWRKS